METTTLLGKSRAYEILLLSGGSLSCFLNL